LDCGEATQLQLTKYNLKMQKIKFILISHLHGDHYFGLPGLITSMALFGRTEPLIIVGPSALESIIQVLLLESDSILPYPLKFVSTQINHIETIAEGDNFEVISVPLKHRVPCTGFIIKEKGPERRLNVDACVKYKVPIQQYDAIKWGADYISSDRVQIKNELLTTDGFKNRSYAYITDTIYDPEYLTPILQQVDLLYHEATFLTDRLSRAIETYHSTAFQAAQIAKMANVGQLLIGHFSARYNDAQPLLLEARAEFESTYEAVEGQTFSVGL
jgi:ribonuclease Z